MQVVFYGQPDTVLQTRDFKRLIEDVRDQLGDEAVLVRDAVSRD